MNEVMHARLSAWGRWSVRAESKGLGYPRVSAGFGDYRPASVSYKSAPPIGVFTGMDFDDMRDLSDAIERLSLPDKMLCNTYYKSGEPHAEVARRLSVCRKTLYLRLAKLHDHLDDILCVESGSGGKWEK